MTITKKNNKADASCNHGGGRLHFWCADATAAASSTPRRVRRVHKVQITPTITKPLLTRVDELAGQIGQRGATVINLAVVQMLENGLRIEGGELGGRA